MQVEPRKSQAFYAVAPGLAYYVLLNLQVAVNEVGAIRRVCHDAAHVCSREYNCIGSFAVEEIAHGHRVEQVEFGMCASYKVVVAALLQVAPYSAAYQAAVSGYVYFAFLFMIIWLWPSCRIQPSDGRVR